jgi:hypothetical protein
MIRCIGPWEEPKLVITEITDPEEVARCQAVREQFQRNGEWLQAHWADVLPQARGKFLAVAGQQAFIAETGEEALALARAAHPDDQGILTQYVFPTTAYRMY